jgi:hypothetical protein
MAATRFDRSKLNAFVQSPCFARNNAVGFRIYCGAKKWRGLKNWNSFFGLAPIGGTVYLNIQAELQQASDYGYLKYHGLYDIYGNGPYYPQRNPDTGQIDYTYGFIDDGSNPDMSQGVGEAGAVFPFPSLLPSDSSSVTDGIHRWEVTRQATFYTASRFNIFDGDPGFLDEGPFTYQLANAYKANDALGQAIAIARAPAVKAGFGISSYYQEESGVFDTTGPSPFARAPFALGASLWYAGWNLPQVGGLPAKPWDGHQNHSAAYKLVDQGAAINFDRVVVSTGNPHKGYLVSRCNQIADLEFPNVFRVVCSTFSGTGALATYEDTQSGGRFGVPLTRMSCVDIAASNLQLNPVLPTLATSRARWQIFFPGKKAADIPLPNPVWNP